MSSKEKKTTKGKIKKEKGQHRKTKNIENQPNGVTIKSEMIKLYKDIPFPDDQLGHLKKLIQVFINDAKKRQITCLKVMTCLIVFQHLIFAMKILLR
ncbi:hypothetical protein [Dickeya fangzhongdai]|uniref:hypothetical protein n=1 Tax=Dickeya fangzhongdai TaxID=1778540 RepID=UPI0026E0FA91|nr:hypothetical protein [Dickeya fangzhongdai]WKV51056.1 hypothetical protein PL145_01920 [Dickeya fangzhongdai]